MALGSSFFIGSYGIGIALPDVDPSVDQSIALKQLVKLMAQDASAMKFEDSLLFGPIFSEATYGVSALTDDVLLFLIHGVA